ncbi:MAG: hypothetical protein CMG64_03400 [Candidatus Marinimicrobia bacterium]|nr:hypothetical protein [Candidatus Neomarinimicrobiota bacterium]
MDRLLFLLFFSFIISEDTYYGGWPKNKDIKSSEIKTVNCPGNLGCECNTDSDCSNDNCQKDLRGKYCSLDVGDKFPEFVGVDQFGDTLNIYDFAKNGKHILIELGATWCAPCRDLASFFTYNEKDIMDKPFWKDEYNILYDMIKNNEIYFITILYEDEFRDDATIDTAYEWYNDYPDENIPIMVDENKFLHRIIRPKGIPAVSLLNEDMEIMVLTDRGLNASFDKIVELYRAKK